MSFLSVDDTACQRDQICAVTCPARIIEFTAGDAVPSLIEGGEGLCLRCGHCVAVCPHGALATEFMRSEDCEPIRAELLPSPESVTHLLKSRRSIRAYREKTVPRDVLAELVDAARYAPTGHNTQPCHWLVIHNPHEVQRLTGIIVDWMRSLLAEGSELAQTLHMDRIVDAWEQGIDRVCRGAPHVLVAHAEEGLRTSQAACTIALAHLELAAYARGLGPCWAGYFNAAAQSYPPMKDALALPEGHLSFGAMMVGYPKYSYHRIPLREGSRISWR